MVNVTNEEELIIQFEEITKKALKNKLILEDFNDEELFIWIAGQTLAFGRTFEDSLANAQKHLEDREEAIRLFYGGIQR